MKKQASAKPRLTLQRETVRQLTDKELPSVLGGGTEPEVTRTTTSATCVPDMVQ